MRFLKENHDKDIDLGFISRAISEGDIFDETSSPEEENKSVEEPMEDMELDLQDSSKTPMYKTEK